MRIIWFTLLTVLGMNILYARDGSVYTLRPEDPEAYYFTPNKYQIRNDGSMDVSDALQTAINNLKKEKNFGILFIPEGKYKIGKTIHVPNAIRLIGYGKNRPEIVLAPNSPGYQQEQNYMIWFTGGPVEAGQQPRDANAGTFYSALSNINLRIEKGNPQAVGIRSHFAQHSFISHCIIHVGQGRSGIFDVGNEMENLKIYGGDYGIDSGRTSPGWPMMMVDTYFEGQRKAAIRTREVGFAIVNMHARNVPVVLEMQENTVDRLHIERSLFENVSKSAIIVSCEDNSFSQLNMQDVYARNTPLLVQFRQSGKKVEVKDKQYRVKDFTYGLILKDMESLSQFDMISQIEAVSTLPKLVSDIPSLPSMDTWVNIRDLGAKGDGETDDTEVFRKAIANHKHIYVPQGWYRLTETLKLLPGTKLIGLHPFATQFVLNESEQAFSGFGAPKPLVESSQGGDDIINGIGINTGGYNYRAVGLKWMANEKSYINDVKFVGGHGTMRKPVPGQSGQNTRSYGTRRISSPDSPVTAVGMDLAWDNQYWSLWVTNNGGGILKDIWTASTYASGGFYVSHTTTPGKVYAMSLEHHVRNEARFEKVSNWRMYAFQFEEEGREGKDCKMMEISNCSNLQFINVWMYRVIRAYTPQEFGVRLWNSGNIEFRNMHNYTQILPVIEIPVYDVNKRIPVYEWDFARLNVSGQEKSNRAFDDRIGHINKLAEGFDFATGITSDSKGNIYFCENRLKKVYKWSAETNTLSMLADYPWKPFTLATDTQDNLLVVFRYDPQPGYLVNGLQESVPQLPDDNPMYSGWGNSGWAAWAYSIDPDNPDETMKPLSKVPTASVKNVKRVIYPSSRWRGDFDKVVVSMPEQSFIAPDGVTIIPETYDLSRSAALTAVTPGQIQPLYVAKESNKTTVKLDVRSDGRVENMQEAYLQGQYSNTVDTEGNLYIADGHIYVYNKDGKLINRIVLEERPISIVIGGKNKNTLFVTTTKALYGIRIR